MAHWWLCFAVFSLAVGLCAAQDSPGDLAAILKNMPQEQRLPLLQALQLVEARDMEGAAKKLQPLVNSGRANVNVSVLLGSLLANARQWQGAADAYQAALTTLSDRRLALSTVMLRRGSERPSCIWTVSRKLPGTWNSLCATRVLRMTTNYMRWLARLTKAPASSFSPFRPTSMRYASTPFMRARGWR
jgi:hypothetical protein